MDKKSGLKALADCRDRIDEIDVQLVHLLNERTRIVEEIGRLKQHMELPVYEPRREDEVFRNVTDNNRGPLPSDALKRLFERIIDEMRSVQHRRMLERNGREK